MRRKPFTPNQFFNYLTKPVSQDQVDIYIKVHNIVSEKANLFFDFICSLYCLVEKTYLGDDVVKDTEDKRGHFNWCWNKNMDNFILEGIVFEREGEHYDYFWSFFYDSFYTNPKIEVLQKVDAYMNRLFKLQTAKTKSELDILVEIYKMLDKKLNVNNLTVKK